MTPDEQEALSKKYVAPMVIVLDSGGYALLGCDRNLIGIGGKEWLLSALDEYVPPKDPPRQAPAKRLTVTLTLEDLDL